MARAWDWQKWGRSHDLIHKSDVNGLIGKFGCLSQFRRKKEEAATGKRVYENASGKLCYGNAVHAVIARILRSPIAVAAMLDPEQHFSRESLESALSEEYEKERAGRPVDWWGQDPDKWSDECVSMLCGLLEDMRSQVGEIVLVECGFVYHVDGIWLTGSIDLVYRAPDSQRLSICDWKSGKQKPHQIDLDHGFEGAIYGGAIRDAWIIPYANVSPPGEIKDSSAHRDEMERVCTEIGKAWQRVIDAGDPEPGESLANEELIAARMRLDDLTTQYGAERFEEYPERIRYVHLRDFIPYTRKTKRRLERPEELEWAGLERPETSQFEKGDQRGPGWYRVVRTESDAPRLRHLLSALVTWIRFGRFPAAPGEMCSRCRFREPCLLDGYKPIGEDKKRLDQLTKEFDFDGFDNVDEV